MNDPMTHKLTEAVPEAMRNPEPPVLNGMPEATGAVEAEQQREAQESEQARNATGGHRDRLVDIGKANHQAGRGNGRVSDQ